MVNKWNPFKAFSIQKFFVFLIVVVLSVQIISLVIHSIFPNVEVIRTGNALILISVAITFVFLANVGFKGEFGKLDILGVLLLGGLTVGMYIYGSQFFPQVFSIFGDSAMQSAQSLQSFLRLP
tara:strand:+ start:187 stop:555 length:369 start_codon:yes stop_codon:yes gene_type:complete